MAGWLKILTVNALQGKRIQEVQKYCLNVLMRQKVGKQFRLSKDELTFYLFCWKKVFINCAQASSITPLTNSVFG